MPVYVLTLRERCTVAWADRRVRRKALRFACLAVGSLAAWVVGKLCTYLPDSCEPACHAASDVVRAIAVAMGGT